MFYDFLWGAWLHICWYCHNVHLISNSSFSNEHLLYIQPLTVTVYPATHSYQVGQYVSVWLACDLLPGCRREDIIKCYTNDKLAYQQKPWVIHYICDNIVTSTLPFAFLFSWHSSGAVIILYLYVHGKVHTVILYTFYQCTWQWRMPKQFLPAIKLYIASFLNHLVVFSRIIVINSADRCSIKYGLNISMKQHLSQKCENP